MLSKKKVKELVLSNRQNASVFLRCYHGKTYEYIEKNFTSKSKFSEKIYKYVFGDIGKCKWCKLKATSFRSFTDGYLDFCSQSCQQKHTASKYGVENLFQSELIKKKNKVTWLKRYGVENPMKSQEISIKGKHKKLEKYGDANFNNPIKNQETCIKKYGVKSVNQVPEIIEKQQASAFTLKEYTFPSGNKIQCQGYEPLALDILNRKYDESDIITSKKSVPEIWYEFADKTHRYFPDIFIKSKNLIVEVKSVYTFENKKEESLKKHDASLKYGYFHEIWIFNTKKELVKKIL